MARNKNSAISDLVSELAHDALESSDFQYPIMGDPLDGITASDTKTRIIFLFDATNSSAMQGMVYELVTLPKGKSASILNHKDEEGKFNLVTTVVPDMFSEPTGLWFWTPIRLMKEARYTNMLDITRGPESIVVMMSPQCSCVWAGPASGALPAFIKNILEPMLPLDIVLKRCTSAGSMFGDRIIQETIEKSAKFTKFKAVFSGKF